MSHDEGPAPARVAGPTNNDLNGSVAEYRRDHYREAERWLAEAEECWQDEGSADTLAAAKVAELYVMLGDRADAIAGTGDRAGARDG